MPHQLRQGYFSLEASAVSKFLPDLEKASPKSQNRRRETAEAKLEKERVSGHVGFAEKEKPSPPSVNAPLEVQQF